MLMRWLLALLCLLLVLGQGIVQGLWTNRWGDSEQLRRKAERLEQMPLDAGEWTGQAKELSARNRAIGEIRGYMLREYRRGPGDPVLSALVLCGLAGPISVHTPDVCYRGAGYELAAPPARHRIERGEGQEPAWFWVGDFEQRGVPAPRRLRIFWGWNAGGGWKAADSARFEFAGAPVLLKLYVIREMSHGGEPLEKDPARGLLRELLAALDTLITD